MTEKATSKLEVSVKTNVTERESESKSLDSRSAYNGLSLPVPSTLDVKLTTLPPDGTPSSPPETTISDSTVLDSMNLSMPLTDSCS